MANNLSIIPIGGLGEIGKNMLALEYGRNILIIDAGIMFPENDMLGVDLVIPDYGYLLDKKHLVRAIILTHGHEDHVGALPYLLRDIQAPIYATRLTRGLVEVKLKQHHLLEETELNTIQAGDILTVGPFRIEFFHVNHSIPDCVGLAIDTPVGLIVHSGDFKFDYTPVDGRRADFAKLAEIGGRGVLALLSDSTNAESPGFTPSERVVEKAFDDVFREAKGRIIVGTFASHISRIQQVIHCAVRYDRKVAVAGRTMEENVAMARELGYLHIPPDTLVSLKQIKRLPPNQITILATGTQGEPAAALARIATGRHRQLSVEPGDTVIMSAQAIPGNEEMVHRTINRLLQRGAHVVYDRIAPVHVSGHASQEEQKLLLSLIRPRYFIPIHGELRHLEAHARTARSIGIPPHRIFVVENGYPIEFTRETAQVGERIPGGYVFVDGAGIGDVGPALMRQREQLASGGFVVIVVHRHKGQLTHIPRIETQGFIYTPDASDLLNELRQRTIDLIQNSPDLDRQNLEQRLSKEIGAYIYSETKRRPILIPIIIEEENAEERL